MAAPQIQATEKAIASLILYLVISLTVYVLH